MTKRLYLIDMDNPNMKLVHGLLVPVTQQVIDEAASIHMRQAWDNLIIANRNGQALLDAALIVSSVMRRHDEENDSFWDALDALDAAIALPEKSMAGKKEVF